MKKGNKFNLDEDNALSFAVQSGARSIWEFKNSEK